MIQQPVSTPRRRSTVAGLTTEVTIAAVCGKRVFFDIPDLNVDAAVEQRARNLNATVVDSRLLADVIVATNPAEPGQRSAWIASLLGLTVISAGVFWKGRGPAVAFAAAIRVPRTIHITAELQQSHQIVDRILRACVAKAASRWTTVDTPQRTATRLVPDSQDPGSGRRAFGPKRFLAFCTHMTAATTGVAGR